VIGKPRFGSTDVPAVSGPTGNGNDPDRSRAFISSFRQEFRLAELWRLSLRPDVDAPTFARALLDEGTRLLDFTSATLYKLSDSTLAEVAAIVAAHDQPMSLRMQQQARQAIDSDRAVRRIDDSPVSILVPIRVNGDVYVLTFWCRLRSRTIDQNDLDFATFLGGVYADFVARRAHSDAVSFLAFHDALTGLPNRTAIRKKLDESLATAGRNERRIALLFIDIDGFKVINDRLGHEAGDLVLKEIGRRFGTTLRAGEFIGRHGGDEFAAIIPDLQREDDTVEVAERLVSAMETPFDLEGQSFPLSASVGIAIYPSDGRTATELLQHGDSAMYRAKSQGGGRVFLFSAHVRDELETRRRLARDLRSAAMSREFLVCYQPIVELTSGHVTGAEALVRWLHPSDGLLAAEAFLGPINSTKLVAVVDSWMIGQAMQQARKWIGFRDAIRKVHINVATSDRSVITAIDTLLEAGGCDPGMLNIEMNESALLVDIDDALVFIEELRSRNLRVGIDRFGSGPSSLRLLARLPVDFVKLDQTLLLGIGNRGDTKAAAAAIAMADAFGWNVIAQGVSNDFQRRWLVDRGVKEAQGYGIGQPMTAVDFEQWLVASEPAAVS